MKKSYWIIFSVFLLKFIFHLFWDYAYTYDHNRNLLVIRDIVQYGTYTYYGFNYVVNPPLYYLLLSIPGAVFGVSHFSIQFFVLINYFLASFLIYKIVFKLTKSEKLALFSFLIAFLNPTSLLIEDIDYFDIVFLMGALLVYTYFDFLDNPNTKNAVIFGIVIGLSMLTKDSFLIFNLLIALHYFIFVKNKDWKNILISLSISFIVYSPWFLYLFINNLPFPWQSHAGDITGNLEWGGYQPMPYYHGYIILLKNCPVIVLVSFYYAIRKRERDPKITFLKMGILFGPLLVRIILSYFVIDPIYFLFVVLFIYFSVRKYPKYIYGLVFVSFLILNLRLIYLHTLPSDFNTCSVVNFAKSLNKSEVVLVMNIKNETIPDYTDFELMSPAKFEYTTESNLYNDIIINDADYIISGTPLDNSSVFKCVGSKYYVIKIMKPSFPKLYVRSKYGKPLANSVLLIKKGNSITYGITDNFGEYMLPIDDPDKIVVSRIGYYKKEVSLNDVIVVLNKLPIFITGDNYDRY